MSEDAINPPPLPAEPVEFYRAGPGIDALDAGVLDGARPALERLGPAPFGKTKFPLLGFLATVYEHVSEQSDDERPTE